MFLQRRMNFASFYGWTDDTEIPCSKIENFIRTKYESKRWVMDGGMPDPSTLDGDGDEDVVRPPDDTTERRS